MLKLIQSKCLFFFPKSPYLRLLPHPLFTPFSTTNLSSLPPLSSSDSEDSAAPLFDNKHIYISKHYKQIDDGTILAVLDKFKLENKRSASGQIIVKYCPFCPKPHNFQRDNQFTLNIKANSGAFFCFRCGVKGSWLDFKNLLYNGGESNQLFDYNKLVSPISLENSNNLSNNTNPEAKFANEALAFLRTKNIEAKDFEFIKTYLTNKDAESRHLTLETLKKYKVGAGFESFSNEKGEFIDVPVVYFPMFVPRSKKAKQRLLSQKVSFDENSFSNMDYMLARNKIRGVGKENKLYQRMEPTPGQWGIFGFNTVDVNSNMIVITEGEFDAMAVNQATGYQAISLPNGANHLPVQILPFLEKFTKIYLWMDADEVGQANAKKFAEKLGINRTFIVNSRLVDPNGPKDANDALREDPRSLEKYLLSSKAVSQENITTFAEMKTTVYNKILKYEESQGLKCNSLEWFNKKLKGFRRGEFSIYSGLTGSGKTTLLSQLSIDFAKQGVPTLWGSFEIKNEILMTNMLLQFSEANLIKSPESFEFYANRFENMPLYFMKFFGSSELDKILSTIDFAIYTYDISHIVIDNLQFLLSGQGRGFEKFDLQDQAVSKFRQMATNRNVHVSLVIHPRKVDDTQEINMSSIFGTAKSTQEADNVFLIQNHKGYKVLELKKNRFDGEVGSIALGFDKETKSYFELYQHEVVDLENEKVKIGDIVNRMRKQKENKVDLKIDLKADLTLKVNLKADSTYKEKKGGFTKDKKWVSTKEKKDIIGDYKEDESVDQIIIDALGKDMSDLHMKINKEKEEVKGGNETLQMKKEEENANKIIKQAASLMNKEEKNEEKNVEKKEKKEKNVGEIIKEKEMGNSDVLEERKRNMMMYNKVEKNETRSFFDEEYKVPKIDEIDDIINNTIKNYTKWK